MALGHLDELQEAEKYPIRWSCSNRQVSLYQGCFPRAGVPGGGGGGGTRSENWWGCAAGRWKLDPKRSREKWNLGPKRSNSLRIGSFNTPKDRFGVGGWEKIPQKDRARSCQSEKRGSKPRHICITHHIGSTPPPPGCSLVYSVIAVWANQASQAKVLNVISWMCWLWSMCGRTLWTHARLYNDIMNTQFAWEDHVSNLPSHLSTFSYWLQWILLTFNSV